MLIEFELRTEEGRLFQSLAPRTLKKFFLRSSLAWGIVRGMNEC